MNLKQLEEYLGRCAPGPERRALLDLVEALQCSSHALYTVNLSTMTRLVKGAANEEKGTPDLFEP